MKLKVWEVAVGALGALFACIFVFSNVAGVGVGLLCADILWLLTRVEIVEKPGRAGRYASLRGRLGLLKVVLIAGIYVAVIYGIVIVDHDAKKTRVGIVASFALAGLAFLLLGELHRGGNDAINWLVGARAERRIGKSLDRLVDKGWFVLHGYKREWGGDIDHVAIGPNGAFMVETKSYAFRRSDLRRAAWNAAWLKEKLEIRWVTGVLCVNEDRPPMLEGAIWVMGHDELLPWLEKQRDTPVDPDRARDVLLPRDPTERRLRRVMRRGRG
jgi:hypothetical protein